ncbi:tRNA (N(6)-L-threonylcarbamoyladenosine(37)-C(2))-methylthiotransferase [Aciduliprofundum sp. MAR08-339]|uniref:tRNA (N(6)-L-threonylcarbamoyladenosine(37)-C(2))- methylthiotransferase n=1 Tax=Aciduliprofundum sp. (strain MAR08-339) TaxID=673860 RepID=UPI001389E34D
MKVYVEAYGCSQNIAETHMLAQAMGEIVSRPEDADKIVIGTCVVIEHTENRMLRRIKELRRYGKDIVVYGCLPSARRELLEDGLIPITTWEFERAHEMLDLRKSPMDQVFLWDAVATIPIANGCLGKCTYCITKIARGHIKSRPVEWIISRVKDALNMGAVEIRLSAQDTAAYGRDIGTNLAELVNLITSLDGRFYVRIGMMEPRETLEIIDELIESYKSSKVYKFLHIPVQSGDDRILRRMNRGYTAEDFERIIGEFRKKIPDITISTDVIVGFPGETDETFANTLDMIQRLKPDILNITRFSPRPKTPAYGWKRPSTNKVKEWSQRVTDLHLRNMEERMKSYVDREMEVVVPSRGKRGNFLARSSNYLPIVVKDAEIGGFYLLKISGFEKAHLKGKIVERLN